ncbi:MAG: adenosine kinase [Rickettsiales bacterium]
MTKQYDVLGIGNAIVDVLSYCEDDFLNAQDLKKSTMHLVDEARSAELYKMIGPSTECSGGSVANTMAGMASLGGRGAFIGKVADDQLGKIFTHDMQSIGVRYHTPPAGEGAPATANCLVFVTPDAQRTMATYIGACALLNEDDIDEEMIAASKMIYIEGYLWNGDHNKAAIRKAMSLARGHGAQIAFTLSDTFCVEAHRDEFLALVQNNLDILFANEQEINALLGTATIDESIAAVKGMAPIIAITRGAEGSVVVTNEHTHRVPTKPVAKLVDTTGAGDLFAAGFLHAHANSEALVDCAEKGNRCAGEIIQQLGARSMKPLKELVA